MLKNNGLDEDAEIKTQESTNVQAIASRYCQVLARCFLNICLINLVSLLEVTGREISNQLNSVISRKRASFQLIVRIFESTKRLVFT